jgi:hypothetical protein
MRFSILPPARPIFSQPHFGRAADRVHKGARCFCFHRRAAAWPNKSNLKVNTRHLWSRPRAAPEDTQDGVYMHLAIDEKERSPLCKWLIPSFCCAIGLQIALKRQMQWRDTFGPRPQMTLPFKRWRATRANLCGYEFFQRVKGAVK